MAKHPLDEVFGSTYPEIGMALEALNQVEKTLKKVQPDILQNGPKMAQFRSCKSFYKRLKTLRELLQECIQKTLELQFTAYWTAKLADPNEFDATSYSRKQKHAKELTHDLRKYGFLIRHPTSGKPCNVLAIATPDNKGRYVLSDRLTKKRSRTSSTLLELLPIQLIKAPRRREAFVRDEDERKQED